jgi:hypothetical protein
MIDTLSLYEESHSTILDDHIDKLDFTLEVEEEYLYEEIEDLDYEIG